MIYFLVVNTTTSDVTQYGSVPDDYDMDLIVPGAGEELVYPLDDPFDPATQYANLDAYPTITIGTKTAITYTLSATSVDTDVIAAFTSITPTDAVVENNGVSISLGGDSALDFASAQPGEYTLVFSHPRRLTKTQTITVTAP